MCASRFTQEKSLASYLAKLISDTDKPFGKSLLQQRLSPRIVTMDKV
jgi:hypothetical protein